MFETIADFAMRQPIVAALAVIAGIAIRSQRTPDPQSCAGLPTREIENAKELIWRNGRDASSVKLVL
jgi:hypothetical protein